MKLENLYGFVLTFVLVGILLGVGLTVLGKMQSASGLTTDAVQGINATVNAIKSLPTDWFGVIVIIVAAVIIIALVFRGFGGGRR